MIINTDNAYTYSTTQSSGDSIIDMYWTMVNRRFINIHNKVPYAYDIEWIDGCIKDAERGISQCELELRYQKNVDIIKLVNSYKSSFTHIIKQLHIIKAGLSK